MWAKLSTLAKTWIVIGVSAVLIAGGAFAVIKMSNTEAEPIATPSPTKSAETNAMVEDFETSMIGYRYDKWKNDGLGANYILILIKDPSELDVPEDKEGKITYVYSSEAAIFPNTSMKPKTIKITSREARHLKTVFSTFPDNLVFEENGAKMYAVVDPSSTAIEDVPNKDNYTFTTDPSMGNNFNFAGINLGSPTTLEIGFPRDNDSYPTEWLRKEPYASQLKDINEVDINNKWYDKWNYQERIVVKKLNTTLDGPDTTVVSVNDINSFSVKDPIAWNRMPLEQMNIQLESMGYDTIPER